MAKQHSTATSPNGMSVTVKGSGRGQNATTVFGNITVSGKKPSAELLKLNVARSTQALERVGVKLITPGVRLSTKKGVPRYSADENRPSVIIRSLNGQITTGRLLNGQFVESE